MTLHSRGLRMEVLEDRVTPAYTATLSGTTATFTGGSSGGSGDIVIFGQSGGLLIHNRGIVDAAFNSEFDFDSTVAGDQTLAVSATSVVNLITGSGPDSISIGGQISTGIPFSAASELHADFNLTKGGSGNAGVIINDSESTTGKTFTYASNAVTATGISVSFSGPAFGGGITLRTGTGNDTVNLTSVLAIANGVEPREVINTGGNDTVNIGSAGGSLDGFAGQPISVFGNGGTTAVVVNDSGDTNGDSYRITTSDIQREDGANDVEVNLSGIGMSLALSTGDGDDTITFASGAGLNGGTLDAGAGVDTIDYTAFNTSVAVNLGLGVTGLTAALDGGQENPATGSAANGTATLSNYSVTNKTFDLVVTVTGLAPADVTGFHFHHGGVGVNGLVVLDLLTLGALTPTADGFTFSLTGVALSAFTGGVANEAALLGGQLYLNIHTAAAPNGLIRGQVFSTGNVNLSSGTATGTGGVSNVENATGGTGNDSLIGSFAANTLRGQSGNDTILGGPGADTFLGESNDDVMIWSNGDGSDVMDGSIGNDTVAVNGNLTANDVFTIGANGSRVAFARVSPGPFTLDIGTTETLTVNGVGGNDTFTLNALAGVTDLTAIGLNGLAGSDTFNITSTSAGITTTARGGLGNDTFTVGGSTLDTILGTVVIDGGGNDAAPTTTQTGSAGPNTLPTGDTLVLDDTSDGTANAYTLDVNSLIRNSSTLAQFARLETVRLNAGSGSDTVAVDASTGVNTVVSAGGGDDVLTLNVGSGANARLDGDAGADTITISGSGAGSVVLLNGGADNDTINVIAAGGSLDNIGGSVVVDGGGHAATPTATLSAGGVTNALPVGDTIRFNDAGDSSNNIYGLASGTFSRVSISDVIFASVESVVLNAGSGKNAVTIAVTSPSTTTTVNGGSDTDTMTVTETGTLSNTAVNGGGGADTFVVNGTGVGSVTAVDGGAGSDTLSVPTAGSTTPNLTTATDASGVFGAFTFGDRGPVGFTAVEAVNPLITSGAAATFTRGTPGTFTVTAAGAPTATFAVTAGTLPGGVTLSAAGVLSGTPTVTGTFPVTITASNGTTPDATQTFTLTVVLPPTVDLFAVASGAGTPVRVDVFNADGTLRHTLNPFVGFAGGASVATGDITGDGIDDIAVGALAGGGPHVKVFDGATGAEIRSFFAYSEAFRGGVSVGLGDWNGDGFADIVTGAGPGGGPHVKVFDGTSGAEVWSFFAYAEGFSGGVNVAAGDVTGDSRADVLTGAMAGGGPHVKVFDSATGSEVRSFFAYDPAFTGGVSVAAGDLNGDGHAEIITGAGPGGGPHVKAFDGVSGQELVSVFAFDPAFSGGVNVAAFDRDADGSDDLMVAAGPGGGPHIRILSTVGDELEGFFAFDPAFLGGVAVG